MSSITSRVDALRAGGVDTSAYLAFGGVADGCFSGSEAAVQIRGSEEPVESCSVESNEAFFGKNSQFYKKVMADGNIYNPYIHRRWLPAQFQRIIKKVGCDNINSYVKTNYDWNYVIRFIKEEAAKLALLEKRDPQAFVERSRFFTLRVISSILQDYKRQVFEVLDNGERMLRRISCDWKESVDITGFGQVMRRHIRPIKHRFDEFCQSVEDCNDNAQLSRLLEAFDFAELPSSFPVSNSFAIPFVEAGAYYTLKHKIMFESLPLGGKNVIENLRLLDKRGRDGFMKLYVELTV